ncbi:HAD family hydrolase [Marinilabiliaceae bacterium JC017]|nr:HAD family hydrolase [Marinilabiliaceae bacterium JC017]
MKQVKVIGFDADDTLWVNEPYFREAEVKFCQLLADFMPALEVNKILLATEIRNLGLYGYGIKGFVLSLMETAVEISNHSLPHSVISPILDLGKELLQKPVILLDGVQKVLQELNGQFRMVVATKGDLLDQQRKLHKSGLEDYFHHIEVMSNKGESDYQKLLTHLEINPEEFLMIGNSMKSDILPVLNLGGKAIHVPFHTTWEHEHVDEEVDHPNLIKLQKIEEVLEIIPGKN